MSKSTKTFFRNLGHLPRGYTVLLPSGIDQHRNLSPGEGITLSNHEISAFTRELFTAQNLIQVIPLLDEPAAPVISAPVAPTVAETSPATGTTDVPPPADILPAIADMPEFLKKPQHEILAYINDLRVTNAEREVIKLAESEGTRKRPKILSAIQAFLDMDKKVGA